MQKIFCTAWRVSVGGRLLCQRYSTKAAHNKGHCHYATPRRGAFSLYRASFSRRATPRQIVRGRPILAYVHVRRRAHMYRGIHVPHGRPKDRSMLKIIKLRTPARLSRTKRERGGSVRSQVVRPWTHPRRTPVSLTFVPHAAPRNALRLTPVECQRILGVSGYHDGQKFRRLSPAESPI